MGKLFFDESRASVDVPYVTGQDTPFDGLRVGRCYRYSSTHLSLAQWSYWDERLVLRITRLTKKEWVGVVIEDHTAAARGVGYDCHGGRESDSWIAAPEFDKHG